MSIKVMSKIWDESKEHGPRLLTLLALADFANDEGIAWPSMSTLAHKIRVQRRAAQKLCAALMQDGELYYSEARGRGHSNLFCVIAGIETEQIEDSLKEHFHLSKQEIHDITLRFAIKKSKGAYKKASKRTHVEKASKRTHEVRPNGRGGVRPNGRGGASKRTHRTTNNHHIEPSDNHHQGGDGLGPLSEYLICQIRDLGIAQNNIATIATLPHTTESFINAWTIYKRDNPNLRGGYFYQQMKAGNVPPSADSATFAAQWRREQSERRQNVQQGQSHGDIP